ncbi:MAG: FAD-dependent oxidoreductase [Alphaproteobacteria bacterium]|nr:FAD-dependent oxidoreductase [Alphaproteobacteria bacterium]
MTKLPRGADAVPGSSRAYHTGTWRDQRPVHVHPPAPCHGACPAGEDPQAYLALMQEGRTQEAWKVLAAVNPLPAVTGRVCPHPCEGSCNRSALDEPIAIHAIERFLGDEAIRQGWSLPITADMSRSERVAIIGAGPAGMSAAYHLRSRGHSVTVFDREAQPGGLLRSAIPPYRLPRDVLDAEVARLLGTGIAFEPHRALGQDVHLDDLRREFAAVFLAPGCHAPRPWTVEGAANCDAPSGLHLIREWLDIGSLPVFGKSVVVHGGGNTAMDAARILRWSGASDVHVIAASALPGESEVQPKERMAAFPREIAQAREEGVVVHPHHTLTRVIVRNGAVVGVEVAAVAKLRDTDEKTHRVSFEGTERIIDADLVVPAIGEIVAPEGFERLLRGNPFLSADGWGSIRGEVGLFAGGDALGTRGTVSASIGDGRRAAEAIDHFLRKTDTPADGIAPSIGPESLNLHYFDRAARRDGAIAAVADRRPDREIEQTLPDDMARSEAERCLSCGNCLACDNCWTFCPDSAVLKIREIASDGSHYVFDYDYCKGCGLCAHECPTGFIAMVEEVGDLSR